MPRLVNATPKYRKHRATGQAVVTIAGKDHYLGPYGTKASKAEYDRLVGEWLAAGRPPTMSVQSDLTITELITAFWRWAKTHYVKGGRSTGTADNFCTVLRLIERVYGPTFAVDFGPKALKSIQLRLVNEGQSRRYANDNIARVKKMFRWAVSEELIPVTVLRSLETVASLEKGRSEARETEPVEAVADETVDATLPYLPPIVADMVRLQRFTGMRPGEVCILRPCDVDATSDVWTYRPESHKTEHHGKARVVVIGPQGQDVLRKYLLRPADAYCFAPVESERKRNAQRREQRQTPMTPSQAKRHPKRSRRRPAGNCYTNDSYRRVIHRACDRAFPAPAPLGRQTGENRTTWMKRLTESQLKDLEKWQASRRWSPNQIRHTAATEIRKRFGLEAAQVALGHSRADVTQIYAEKNLDLARQVAREVG